MKDDGATAAPLPVSPSRGGGRYTLRSLLGRGGMGEVYLAHDERLRRRVAIKRIRATATIGTDAQQLRARLEQEARLLAQLEHPAIVQVFDIFEDEDGAWVVMELVQGRTLAAVADAAPVGVDEVLSHGVAIAAALEVAHRQGIIHRDLKVENVMLSASGQIKVLDFGLAKRLVASESAPELSAEGQVLGTVRTMAPEQARGLPVDERSDLFSLGVLLYELASGRSPFAGATAMDTLVRLSTHRQPSLVELPGLAEVIPRALSELVDELLEKAAEQRPASAADVRARLQAIAESRPRAPADAAALPKESAPAPRWRAELEQQATEVSVATAPLRPPRDREPSATAGTSVERAPSPRRPRARPRLALGATLGALAAAAVAAAILTTRAAPEPDREASPLAAGSQSAGSQIAAGSQDAPAPRRDPKAEYERGMALLRDYHRTGAIDEAAGLFQRLLRDNDRSAPAYAGLARAYWYRYMSLDTSRDAMFLQQARAAADRAVALDEFLADARVSQGLIELERGQLEAAEKAFRTALALDGKNAGAHEGMARVHRLRQRPDEAEAAYRKAIELDPKARYLHDDLGGLLVQRGRYQEAIPLFEQSIALAPDSAYGYSNLGAVYLLLGRYDEAAERLQDALKIRPSSSTYSNLGTVLFAQGLYGPAASAFERALATGGGARDYQRWANLADAYRQLPDSAAKAREHYAHAIEILDAELARSPQDPSLRSRRALYQAKRGDCRSAEPALASLVDARDLPPYAVFRVGVALEICGQRQRAIAMLERALGLRFSPAEIDHDPELQALRADPTYLRMIRRRGQTPISSDSPTRPR